LEVFLMDDQDVLNLPFPDMVGMRDKTVGEVVKNLQSVISKKDRDLNEMQKLLHSARRERDELLGRLESTTKEIDSFKILDLLTRSSLVQKLQISEDSELGRELSRSLASALQALSRRPTVLELEE
jgi:hypothetical protein